MVYNDLKEICALNGVSGDEANIRQYILGKIQDLCSVEIDPLGNIIAYKKGQKTRKQTLMVCAHMDEVGMIVTGYTTDGMLRIAMVGGLDARVIIGRTVTVGNGISGVIGTKAVHMQSPEEREAAVSIENLYVDIGAKDKEDVQKYVQLGDCVYFQGDYQEYGEDFIRAKAIDDRVGCALMIALIRSELMYDTVFVFNTQEEIGLRGAKASSFAVNPDIAIVLEATTAADFSEVPAHKQVCQLKKGAVVGFMDRATIYDKQLVKLAFHLCKENDIRCQTKTMIAGGNDAGAITQSRGGVRTIAVSVPCRYLHSPFCATSKQDIQAVQQLLRLLVDYQKEMVGEHHD